ncbi:hypothetical protein N7E81_11640 [Reichenbachiella carrageenanivorans]|uniref:Uncharacterized protein n=1 Tax=Reichenbachiella carrageenanivorans TaxID=2979869 RepID=A0ABY6CYW7_9BACT|nr:hypothetical protein [Reichenbachiella carrageenanivorans]UXX78013.1 hypothetical protein N7E81_11640 [Reichenbachiella carrageenanivorans]
MNKKIIGIKEDIERNKKIGFYKSEYFDNIYEDFQLDVMKVITRTFVHNEAIEWLQALRKINYIFSQGRPLFYDQISIEETGKRFFRVEDIIPNLELLTSSYQNNYLIEIIKTYFNVDEYTPEDQLLNPNLFKDLGDFYRFNEKAQKWLLHYLEILDAKQIDIWKINEALKHIENEKKPVPLKRKDFANQVLNTSYDTYNRFINEAGLRNKIPKKGNLDPDLQDYLKEVFNSWRYKK